MLNDIAKKEIVAYLSGPRDYREGAALYARYGANLMYKRRFALDETEATKAIMIDALRRLAGLSEAEFLRLPRLAKSAPASVTPQVAAVDDTLGLESMGERAPEPVQKMIRFRDRFPFLNSPDCPDVLKVLVADMFTAYGNYKTAFAHLQTIPDETVAEAAALAEQVVTNYLADREIWAELEHYKSTGEILGQAAKFREIEAAEDLAALSDVDLIKKLDSARANVSKNKRKVADLDAAGADSEKAAALLQEWTDRKAALEAEADRRKKK